MHESYRRFGIIFAGIMVLGSLPVVPAGASLDNQTTSSYAGADWSLDDAKSSRINLRVGRDVGPGSASSSVVDLKVTQRSCAGNQLVELTLAKVVQVPVGVAVDPRGGTATVAATVTLTGDEKRTPYGNSTCSGAPSGPATSMAKTEVVQVGATWLARPGDPLRYSDRGSNARFLYRDAAATGTLTSAALGIGALPASATGFLFEGVYTYDNRNNGYWLVSADAGICIYGNDAGFYGSPAGTPLNRPIVGIEGTIDNDGYWLVAADGGIFAYGAARFRGSAGAIPLVKPIVGMAATPTGLGYWLVAADGGIFAYGDAGFHGSLGGTPINRPIVAMATTPSGQGYWLVAADGGIFAFGDAAFYGSTGGLVLNSPIVDVEPGPYGDGYWLAAADGGLFAFGGVPFLGSAAPLRLQAPIVGLAATPTGDGYWLVGADGGVLSYGGAAFRGSTGAARPNHLVVGVAATK